MDYQLVAYCRLDTIEVTMDNKKLILIVVIMLIIAGGIGFWYWSKSKQVPSSSLGSEIFDKTQNQLQGQVPDANPFKDQKNPLDAIYQNPFE